jgi:thiamine biosynthesis protein ThiS
MIVHLNGEQRDVPDGLTLAGLVEWLELPSGLIAIERNLEVVKRQMWNDIRIEQDDQLEIVRMVGGGSASCILVASRNLPCSPQ